MPGVCQWDCPWWESIDSQTQAWPPLAGSVLGMSEILGFLGSPEVTLAHWQKEPDAILLWEKALYHLRDVTGGLPVFVWSKYRLQLSDLQSWIPWFSSRRSLGRSTNSWKKLCTGFGEHSMSLWGSLPDTSLFSVLQSTRSDGGTSRWLLSQRLDLGSAFLGGLWLTLLCQGHRINTPG